MRASTIGLLFFTFAVAVAIDPSAARAQSTDAHDRARPELAITYNYGHSNAPAGGCGCFNFNGGSATFEYPLRRAGISLVGDISATHAGAISGTGQDLTLSTFTAGARYSPPRMNRALRPFGEILIGVAHAGGSFIEGAGSSATNSGAAFASLIGGGVDLRATRHFSIRLIEADYLVTTFDNGSNNHQNNLRINTGLVFRF